jgi:hypothetical protein
LLNALGGALMCKTYCDVWARQGAKRAANPRRRSLSRCDDAAVFCIPNDSLGEEVKAVVQLMPDISAGPEIIEELMRP